MAFTLYILRTSGNTLYVGQTNDLPKRIEQHTKKIRGAKYLRRFDSFQVVHTEIYQTRSEALKRELQIKSWNKIKKESLLSGMLDE